MRTNVTVNARPPVRLRRTRASCTESTDNALQLQRVLRQGSEHSEQIARVQSPNPRADAEFALGVPEGAVKLRRQSLHLADHYAVRHHPWLSRPVCRSYSKALPRGRWPAMASGTP